VLVLCLVTRCGLSGRHQRFDKKILHFSPEDGGRISLRNIDIYVAYMSKRRQCYKSVLGSHRSRLTAEAWVRSRVSPYVMYGEQGGSETGFSLSSSTLACQCHRTVALHTCLSTAGWTIGLLVAVPQKHSVNNRKKLSSTILSSRNFHLFYQPM
jgi:hypothetical protein